MADDFVRQFQNGPPLERPMTEAEEMRADDIEWEARKRLDPKLVSTTYDAIMDAMTVQHQAAELHGPDAARRDDEEREERQFLKAFELGLNDSLRQIGMRVMRLVRDDRGTDAEQWGWRVQVRDSEGRPFAVTLTYDDAAIAGSRYGRNMGQHLVAQVMAKLIGARQKYFARMQ